MAICVQCSSTLSVTRCLVSFVILLTWCGFLQAQPDSAEKGAVKETFYDYEPPVEAAPKAPVAPRNQQVTRDPVADSGTAGPPAAGVGPTAQPIARPIDFGLVSHPSPHARRLPIPLTMTASPPTQASQNCSRGKWIVYGFHLGGESSSVWKSYQFDLLSHIAYCNYNVDVQTGGPASSMQDWTTTALVDSAHAAGCKVHLTVSTVNLSPGSYTYTMLSNPVAAQACIDSVCHYVRLRKADGVCLDFEDMQQESDAPLFLSWVTSLRAALQKDNPKAELVVAGPAIPPSTTFTQAALYQVINFNVIMDYEFSGSWDTQPSCTSPLPVRSASGAWDLTGSVQRYLQAGVSPSQLVMGLPYYGPAWITSGNTASTPPGTFDDYPTIGGILQGYPGNGYVRTWDAASQSSYYVAPSSGQYRQAWVLDSASMAIRYDSVIAWQLAGAGIWALGYDAGTSQMWDLINAKFGSCKASTPSGSPDTDPAWVQDWRWILPWACLGALMLFLATLWFNRKAREEMLNKYWLFPIGGFIGMTLLVIGYESIRAYLQCCISARFPWLILLGTAVLVLGFVIGRWWADRRSRDE